MVALLSCTLLILLVGLLPAGVQSIVGGVPAQPGEFPHHALIGWSRPEGTPGEYDFGCGGSLIHSRFVLTVAHCGLGSPQIVRLGAHSLNDSRDHWLDVEIESFMKHPDYSFRSSYNDIALVKLKDDVASSEWIRPACLWKGSHANLSTVIATGFGVTRYSGSLSSVLRKVELNFLNRTLCEAKFDSLRQFPDGIRDSQLCIGNDQGGKDTCQGDAGGPVQVLATDSDRGCRYYAVGITSMGDICGGPGPSAAIYTNIASFVDWIEGVVMG